MTGVVVPLELELLELELLDRLEEEVEAEVEAEVEDLPEEPEVELVKAGLLLEAEVVLEPELVEAEVVLEPEVLELELPLPCRTTVPVRISGLTLSGVTVSVVPEAQYEYCGPGGEEVVITLPAVVSIPLVEADDDTTPIPPLCWTVPEQAHPPPVAAVHVIEEYPAAWRGPLIPSHVVVVPEIMRHVAGNMSCSVPDVVVLSV